MDILIHSISNFEKMSKKNSPLDEKLLYKGERLWMKRQKAQTKNSNYF